MCVERVQREWEGKPGGVDMIKIHWINVRNYQRTSKNILKEYAR